LAVSGYTDIQYDVILDETTKTTKGLHIRGYPTASHLKKISTPKAREMADLFLHRTDLVFCWDGMQEILSLLNQDAHKSRFFVEAFWISVITKYFGCFKKSKARIALNLNDVYGGFPSEAIKCFKYFEALRDKHIAHDDNSVNFVAVGAVLEADGSVLDFIMMQARAETIDMAHLDPMFQLIDVARKFVESRLEKLRAEVLDEIGQIPKDKLLALPNVTLTSPTADDIQKSRSY